jgi:signal transduction histidine kinase
MLTITRKDKIALQFSLLNSVLIVLTILSFSTIIYIFLNNSLKEGLIREAEEIINNHIDVIDERIVYKLDSSGNSIESDLLTDQASAIIYNSTPESVGSFGLFEIKQDMLSNFSPSSDVNIKNIKEVLNSKKYTFDNKIVLYGENNYEVLTYPVVKDGISYGVVQVAVKTKQLDQLTSVASTILIVLLPISILLSFGLGGLFALNVFRPIKEILVKMHAIHGKNLTERVKISGPANDEIVQLGTTFNNMLSRIEDFSIRQESFVSNASHELKTPLTRAISTLEAVEFSIKDKDIKESINATKEDLFDLNSIMQSLLFLAKASNIEKLRNINYDVFPVSEVISNIIKRYEAQIKSKHLIISELKNEEKLKFPREYFEIIISNLISNSIKYSYSKSEIEIKVNSEGSNLTISITDHGIGMSKQELEKIYERFYRSHSGISFAEGSGLGMSVVKSICNAFDLNLDISSEKNIGTSIKVTGFKIAK